MHSSEDTSKSSSEENTAGEQVEKSVTPQTEQSVNSEKSIAQEEEISPNSLDDENKLVNQKSGSIKNHLEPEENLAEADQTPTVVFSTPIETEHSTIIYPEYSEAAKNNPVSLPGRPEATLINPSAGQAADQYGNQVASQTPTQLPNPQGEQLPSQFATLSEQTTHPVFATPSFSSESSTPPGFPTITAPSVPPTAPASLGQTTTPGPVNARPQPVALAQPAALVQPASTAAPAVTETASPAHTPPEAVPGETDPQDNRTRFFLITAIILILSLVLGLSGLLLYRNGFTGGSIAGKNAKVRQLANGVEPLWKDAAPFQIKNVSDRFQPYTISVPKRITSKKSSKEQSEASAKKKTTVEADWLVKQTVIVYATAQGNYYQEFDLTRKQPTGKPEPLPDCQVESGQEYRPDSNGEMKCQEKDKATVEKQTRTEQKIPGELVYIDVKQDIQLRVSVGGAQKLPQVVAYTLRGELLWILNLPFAGRVQADHNGIYLTSFDSHQGSGKILIYQGRSTPSPEKPDPKQIFKVATDAIKSYDISNSVIPGYIGDCPAISPAQGRAFLKVPNQATTNHCWVKLVNGKTLEDSTHAYVEDPVSLAEIIDPNTYLQHSITGLTREGNYFYGDINQDGYLDAVFAVLERGIFTWVALVFDPNDPQHPYALALEIHTDGDARFTMIKNHFQSIDLNQHSERIYSEYDIENINGVPTVKNYHGPY